MDPRSIPEIREAIELLESYEQTQASYADAKEFMLAIETLEDYLTDHPETPHRQFIQNLRFSHTRRMLQRLASVNKADAGASIDHIVMIVHTVKNEAEKLMELYPELRKDFDALISVWADPLARALVAEEEEKERQRKNQNASHT